MDSFYFPSFLRDAGYFTGALVSFPAISPPGVRLVDRCRRYNDRRALLAELSFPSDRPAFWMRNAGETHFPYALPDENCGQWTNLTGANGVFRSLAAGRSPSLPPFFDPEQVVELRSRQVRAAEHPRRRFRRVVRAVAPDTWVCIMGDHGELFGEDGYWGHGPIQHPKVLAVPFPEGLIDGNESPLARCEPAVSAWDGWCRRHPPLGDQRTSKSEDAYQDLSGRSVTGLGPAPGN